MDLTSHLGTHCECPYHHDDEWPSVAELPLTTFMGRAIYVDFKDTVKPYTHITAADLDRATAGKIQEGDIVIIDSSYKLPPFTDATNTEEDHRLLIGQESAEWFRDHKVKCVGFGDGVSIENCNEDVKPFHDILMAENIVFLEVLKNLDKLEKDVFFMSYSPLPTLKEAFDSCGFQVKIHENIQQLIWDKLFTNVSLSAVTGILQVDMGYIAGNDFAWKMTKQLIHEAVVTAEAMGIHCDEEAITDKVKKTSLNNPTGCTSIRADLANGRKTEVNTISGTVVSAAAKCGIKVPTHEFVVNMVHAMEER